MGNSNRLALLLAGSAVAAAMQWPANAQCRLCDTPTTLPGPQGEDRAIRLEIETNLDFDRLILVGEGAGSAMLRPDGTSSAHGALAQVGPRAMVGSALVRGEPGRALRIELPPRIVLQSGIGAPIRFEDVVSDLPALPRLDATGSLRFRFGGRLELSGEAEGEYRGDLPITVEYL